MDKLNKVKPNYNCWKKIEKMSKKELQSEIARLMEVLEITSRRLDALKTMPP
jgi:hypothetical protein